MACGLRYHHHYNCLYNKQAFIDIRSEYVASPRDQFKREKTLVYNFRYGERCPPNTGAGQVQTGT